MQGIYFNLNYLKYMKFKAPWMFGNCVSNKTDIASLHVYNIPYYRHNCKRCFYLPSIKHNLDGNSSVFTQGKYIAYSKEANILTEHYAPNKSDKVKYKPILCKRFITIGRYFGRIGNQMFQIASLIGTAYSYDLIPVIPYNNKINNYFDLPYLKKLDANKLLNVVECKEMISTVYNNCTEAINTGHNISMYGYMQSWKYFNEARDIIRTVFKLKQNHWTNARTFLSRVSLKGYKIVCIHIRRGDILSKRYQELGFVTAGLEYIGNATQFFKTKYTKVQFLVVSNDKAWCKMNIKGANISTLTNPGDELALMALSDDVVITTGTFGWWGAWLSGGTTLYFNKHPRPGSKLASRMIKENYYPPNWIGVG